MALWDLVQGKWALANTTYTDDSGNGYTLTAYNSPTAGTGHAGGVNSATTFANNNQYLQIADASAPNLRFSGACSFSFWIYINSFTSGDAWISKGGGATSKSYVFYSDATTKKMTLYLSANGTSWDTTAMANTVMSVGSWYHIASVYDGTDVRVYINGALDMTPISRTSSIYNASQPFTVGRSAETSANFTDARIDDIAVWSRALSAAEVAELFALREDFFPIISITDTLTISDSASYTQAASNISVTDSMTVTDDIASLSALVQLLDETLTMTDSITAFNGALQYIADSMTATDTIVAITTSTVITDNMSLLDSASISQPQASISILEAVFGFPPAQNVQYRIMDSYQNIIQNWTSTGIVEIPLNSITSKYQVLISPIAQGTIDWQIPSTNYWACGLINLYDSNIDVTLSSRLAASAYTAPDNASIAGILVIVTLLQKYVKNKKEIKKTGAVSTLYIYDNDGVTSIVQKDLKDKDGKDITALVSGLLALENASSV